MTTTDDSPRTGTETLSAVRLTKTFRTSAPPLPALDGIDLRVGPGEFLAVMGPSGSGKSTLLHCLSGLDRPSSGEVTVEGLTLADLTDRETAHVRLSRMGFVFQQAYFLDNLNVRDNILLPALKADAGRPGGVVERVDGLLERFGIGHISHHGVTEVSGGQLQRAALCRALATQPAILFADEPTGALGSSMGTEVLDALAEVHGDGMTIVMATHSPACAARADRVVYLRDGSLVDTLVLEDIAADPEATLQDWLREKGY